MDFSESLEYLLDLGNEVLAMKLGLENIGKLLDALGSPERNFLKIQVAGTNGKGSTCAFLDSICVSANIKTGLFTSPHLVSITERIKINGQQISEENFARHASKIRKNSEKLLANGELETLPTFFEQVTAIAISAFDEAKIELAILETGLGGRFDATTATNAEIVAITPIDFDHQDILGNTLKEIAAEKAAIIREDTKVIIASQPKEAKCVIIGKCHEKQIEPIWATTNIKIKKQDLEYGNAYIVANFTTPNDNYPDIVLGLRGRHQLTNASLAIGIAETLREFDFKVSNQDICVGLQNTKYKGRLEFYKGILFDGAHNIAGAKALAEYFDEFINQPITLVFGAMRDKDLHEIAEILFPKAASLILTKPDNPRSMETSKLLKFVPKGFDKENLVATETVEEALKIAPFYAMRGIICVTGSLYLVGEAQRLLAGRKKQ
jgi:dihydrofolate synthase/folylpolyglutamate synthase